MSAEEPIVSDKPLRGKDVQKLADEAQAEFKEIAVKYNRTPWAFFAKQEQKQLSQSALT